MLQYRAAYTRSPDSDWFVAQVLDFPGAISQGKSLDAARRMLRDALRELAEHLIEQGEPLPRPNPEATDPDANLIEPIELGVRVHTGQRP